MIQLENKSDFFFLFKNNLVLIGYAEPTPRQTSSTAPCGPACAARPCSWGALLGQRGSAPRTSLRCKAPQHAEAMRQGHHDPYNLDWRPPAHKSNTTPTAWIGSHHQLAKWLPVGGPHSHPTPAASHPAPPIVSCLVVIF